MSNARPLVRLTEIKANPMPRASQFGDLLEMILRYELGILLDENKARYAFFFEGDFFMQNQDYICDEIARKLATDHKLYPDTQQIKDYLARVSQAIEDSGAESYSALSYASKSYQKKAKQALEEKEAKIMRRPSPLANKGGRPRKEAKKRNHKRRFLHPNGEIYDSIKQAAEDNHESYSALRKHAYRQMKKAQKGLGTNGDNFL